MNDWALVALVFWGAFVLDGIRRSRRARFAVVRALAFGRARTEFSNWFFVPPLPWQWRLWSDDPAVAFSPDGIVNQPVGGAGRPADRPKVAVAWRWEEISTVEDVRGWLRVNGRTFAPAVAALPAARLQTLARELAPLPPAARAARLERELRGWFRPAHWNRRWTLLRRRTRWVAASNTVTLAGAALLTAAALPSWQTRWLDAAEVVARAAPYVAAGTGASYLAGVVLALVAARRLKRWLRPGAPGAIGTAALFPPQGLRWRTLLAETLRAAPHPLVPALQLARAADRREAAFFVLADLAHPAALPADAAPAAAAIRAWYGAALRGEVEKLFATATPPISAATLLAAPAPDGPTSCAYCPRCGAQFVRADGRCPQGVALLPLTKR